MAPETAGSKSPLRDPIAGLLRERLERRDVEFSERYETSLAREDHVLELKSFLVKSASDEANLRSNVTAMETDLGSVRANLTTFQSSLATTTSELDKLRADNRRLASQLSKLTTTAHILRLQLSSLQSFIFSPAPDSLRSKRDRYMGLLRSLAGQRDHLDSDFTTLFTQMRNSHSFIRRGAGTFPEEIHTTVDEDDILKDAPSPPPS